MKLLNLLFVFISTTFGSIGLIGITYQFYIKYVENTNTVNETNLIGTIIITFCYFFIMSFCINEVTKQYKKNNQFLKSFK